jgi:hypothetical protein
MPDADGKENGKKFFLKKRTFSTERWAALKRYDARIGKQ